MPPVQFFDEPLLLPGNNVYKPGYSSLKCRYVARVLEGIIFSIKLHGCLRVQTRLFASNRLNVVIYRL